MYIHVTECYLTAQFITCAVHTQHTVTCTPTYYSHRKMCKTFLVTKQWQRLSYCGPAL